MTAQTIEPETKRTAGQILRGFAAAARELIAGSAALLLGRGLELSRRDRWQMFKALFKLSRRFGRREGRQLGRLCGTLAGAHQLSDAGALDLVLIAARLSDWLDAAGVRESLFKVAQDLRAEQLQLEAAPLIDRANFIRSGLLPAGNIANQVAAGATGSN